MNLLDQAKQAAQKLQERLSLRRDYAETFGTPHGQRVLADIMAKAGVTTPRFHADPSVTQFNEGARHMAFSIFRQVHGSFDKLPALIADQIRTMEKEQEDQN